MIRWAKMGTLFRSAPSPARARKRKSVLLVDDEVDVREVAEEMLRRLGLRVVAHRPQCAHAPAAQFPPVSVT